jgi:murein DD-endopeptidase MepM/ murein hydrolase activator NlpD
LTTLLFPGQPLLVQAPAALPEPTGFGAVLVVLPPPDVVQGRTGRLLVESRRPLDLSAAWNDLPLVFTPVAGNALRQFALVPAPALLTPAPYTLTVAYTATNGTRLQRTWQVLVSAGDYESQIIDLDPERSALLDPVLVQTELEKVTALWSQVSPTLLWTQPFTRPIDGKFPTTSPFGTRRGYEGGPIAGYHAGQDFGVPEGVTVTSPADGIVVLAEPLQVRGNAVIVDHGRGIFSGYWHLSEIKVAPGQSIHAGNVLGLSGNTGLSTGAHLHWELRIYGIAVDPMQFLSEPFPPVALDTPAG